MSKLVEVRFRDLVEGDDCAGLAVRWEAIGFLNRDADAITHPPASAA
jgi:hypothetical protein